jgi:ABC-type lipoprotein export system ATPase subunit
MACGHDTFMKAVILRTTPLQVFLPNTDRRLFHLKPLEFVPGKSFLIQGPSGKGKTTFLHLLAGLFIPSEGHVLLDEHDLRYLSDESRAQLRRRYYSLLFQRLNLLDHLTALENVLLSLSQDRNTRDIAKEALATMGIESLSGIRSGVLSLGEQQRIAVARVLVSKPNIVLADEPTSSLDDRNAEVVMDKLLTLPQRPILIVVSHDRRFRSRFDSVLEFEELEIR